MKVNTSILRQVSYLMPLVPRLGIPYKITPEASMLINRKAPKDYRDHALDEFECDRLTLKCLAMNMENRQVRYIPYDEDELFNIGLITRIGFWTSSILIADIYGLIDISPIIPVVMTIGCAYTNLASDKSVQLKKAMDAVRRH